LMMFGYGVMFDDVWVMGLMFDDVWLWGDV
jgi:hypothetical protein